MKVLGTSSKSTGWKSSPLRVASVSIFWMWRVSCSRPHSFSACMADLRAGLGPRLELEEAAHGIPDVTAVMDGVSARRVIARFQCAKQAAGFGEARFMGILWCFHEAHEVDDVPQFAQQIFGERLVVGKVFAIRGIKQVMVVAPGGVALGKDVQHQLEGAGSGRAAGGRDLEKLFFGEFPGFAGVR